LAIKPVFNFYVTGKQFVCLFLFLSVSALLPQPSFASSNVDADGDRVSTPISTDISFEVEASSEPVPIHQMIEGWEKNADTGTFAYADMSLKAGADYGAARVFGERRWFYSLKFSPDTTAVYLDAEFGQETDSDRNVLLDARSFEAKGVGGAYRIEGKRWSVTPEFTLYKLIHYQFGTFYGRSFTGDGTNLSARLSYYFDEYRFPSFNTLPDYEDPTGSASTEWYGYSASVSGSWQATDDIGVSIKVRDLWNRLDMFNSAHRSICAEVGDISDPVCSGSGAASGDDNPEEFSTSIKSTVIANGYYAPEQIHAQYYWHDKYRNLSIEKRFVIDQVQLGIVLSSRRQAGLTMNWQGLSLAYIADNLDYQKARDARLKMGFAYRW